MLEFLGDKKLVKENPFETAKIKKLHFLPFMGLTADDYGGRVKHVAAIHGKDFLLIVDKDLRTIDIAKIKQTKKTK